jgi:UDP-2,3-diacylglucosamine hydrolase
LADVVLSDVHLRLDHPERGRRLARVIDTVSSDDRLIILGDLCDFWFSTRQRNEEPRKCAGLRSLLDFRSRGGSIVLLLGNHDAWMGGYYERLFDLQVTPEPFEICIQDLRLHLAHGHWVKSKMWWKHLMEGRLFHAGFERLPGFIANRLQFALDRVNEGTRRAAEMRMIAEFEEYARALSKPAEVVVFGHVHRVHDTGPGANPRLIVLGDWTERTNFLRIEGGELRHHSAADGI